LLKLAVQHTKEQAAAVAAAAGDAREDEELSQLLMISPIRLFTKLLLPLGPALPAAVGAAVAATPTSSSSSSGASNYPGQQATASAVFLAVLVLRGFVQVHEAAASMPGAAAAGLAQDAAAAPVCNNLNMRVQQMMFCMLTGFRAAFLMTRHGSLCAGELEQQLQQLQAGLVVSRGSSSAAAAAAVDNGQEQLAAAPAHPGLHSSSSSSSSQPVRWQHLLRFYPSRKLVAAYASFGTAWSVDKVDAVLSRSHGEVDAASQGQILEEVSKFVFLDTEVSKFIFVDTEQLAEMRQLYQDALRFCMTVTALAPLPVVCNNPGCDELSSVSEAAAARYVCAGCGCRYCSAACQAAGWRSDKKACRRMAAYGLRVEGG
jgi:hypothetical protein